MTNSGFRAPIGFAPSNIQLGEAPKQDSKLFHLFQLAECRDKKPASSNSATGARDKALSCGWSWPKSFFLPISLKLLKTA